MKSNQTVKGILARMIELLKIGNEISWATSLEEMINEIDQGGNSVNNKIIMSFGGMGSLNDVVLQKSGIVLKIENDEFDELRAALFDACHSA